MATSRCGKCDGTTFELKGNRNVRHSEFKIMFVQCANCGVVVGTTDIYNVPLLLEKLAKHLGFSLGV